MVGKIRTVLASKGYLLGFTEKGQEETLWNDGNILHHDEIWGYTSVCTCQPLRFVYLNVPMRKEKS